MGSVSFNDGSGSVTLRGIFYAQGAVASRFKNWTPFSVDEGDRATALSSGRVVAAFLYRTNYGASFDLVDLSPKGPSGINMLTAAQRFVRWATNGGQFAVFVEDDDGNPGRDCYAQGAPVLSLQDPKRMLYTLSIRAVALSGGEFVCVYGGARE